MAEPAVRLLLGGQTCGDLAEASTREWLLADGLGGYACGTVAGLRTRRYHGLLVVAGATLGQRHLGLASLDPILVLGGNRVRLATHEWADGTVAPAGYRHLAAFWLHEGLPCWRFSVDGTVLDVELAMAHGQPAVALRATLVRALDPVELEVEALCTWRDAHGQRYAGGEVGLQVDPAGFSFEGAYRVEGPGFTPAGQWWYHVHYREEARRGLPSCEDLFLAGRFRARLSPGESLAVRAWALQGQPAAAPAGGSPGAAAPCEVPPAGELIAAAHRRSAALAARAGGDATTALLAVAADRFVVGGPAVVAGYPWFGEWSRDTMTSYPGLFLLTGRAEEGRRLLVRAAGSLREGLLANTTDSGAPEYNAADASLWFLHAVDRHVEHTGDLDLAAELLGSLEGVVEHYLAGTRFGIRADPADALVTQGAPGTALTWMDARVDGEPVTPRAGKAVEVNALWVNGLRALAGLRRRLGADPARLEALAATAAASFQARFCTASGALLDVVDGPSGDSAQLRPNQLLAVALPYAPLADPAVVRSAAALLTPLGLRSLGPADPGYRGLHRGGPAERDRAYHQGTVWPWLVGPYADACRRTGVGLSGVLRGLTAHLGEHGLGSVSETADGDAPHAATGCPFQAWSVAEVLRALALAGGT